MRSLNGPHWTIGIQRIITGLVLGIALAMGLIYAQTTKAATLDVCPSCTYTTIQAAVNAAAAGDTIRVVAGTYNENVTINKSLTLLGGYNLGFASRTPRSSKMSASGDSALSISGNGVQVTVDGFEITGGNAPTGGGANVEVGAGSLVSLNDNYIHDNIAAFFGGGVRADLSDGSTFNFTNNDVKLNTSNNAGGGLHVIGEISSAMVITGNTIVENDALLSGGMDLKVTGFSLFSVTDNQIEGNQASQQFGGLNFLASDHSEGVFDRNHVVDNDAYQNGGAVVSIEGFSTASFSGNEFINNTASEGAGGLWLTSSNQSQVTGDQLLVSGNTTYAYYGSASGGVVLNSDLQSSLEITHLQLTGNQAPSGSHGGGLLIASNNSTIEVPGMNVIENSAGYSAGGVKLVASTGDLILAPGAQVISNTAQYDNAGGMEVISTNGSQVNLSQSDFINNHAGWSGGGLFVYDLYNGANLGLQGSQFISNTAYIGGGGAAVYGPLDGATLNLTGASFIANEAESGGGLMMSYLAFNGIANLIDTEFTGNIANWYGGGAYIGPTFLGAQIDTSGSLFQLNQAYSSGGGIFLTDCIAGCIFTMDGGEIISNTAHMDDGGGINLTVFEYENGGGFKNRRLRDTEETQEVPPIGGSQISLRNVLFQANQAGGHGGGLAFAPPADQGPYNSNNNAVLLENPDFEFSHNQVIGNFAGEGGGVYFYSLATFGGRTQFDNNRLENNQAYGIGGGGYLGIVDYGSQAAILKNEVISNTAGGNGAGLALAMVMDGSAVWIQDNLISANQIDSFGCGECLAPEDYYPGDGGGIAVGSLGFGSSIWATGNVITNNIAYRYGGGWSLDTIIQGSTLVFEDNLLAENQAEKGGACRFGELGLLGSQVTFSDNQIENNLALNSGGCDFGILSESSQAVMHGNVISGNIALNDTGGFNFDEISDGSSLEFWDNQLTGNMAGIDDPIQMTGPGGNNGGMRILALLASSTADLQKNLFQDNLAYDGDYGGLSINANQTSSVVLEENKFLSNQAGSNFGGASMVVEDASRLELENNVFSGNEAGNAHGGLYLLANESAQYLLSRNRIIGNNAPIKSGLVLETTTPTIFKPTGESVNNLVAANTNGGLYLGGIGLKTTNDTIANNGIYGIALNGGQAAIVDMSNGILWGNTIPFSTTNPGLFSLQATYSDIQGGLPGTGNIADDPLFAGSENYHLQAGSPAIDQITPASAPPVDLDGIPRPIGPKSDMGALEWFKNGVLLAPDQALSGAPGSIVTYTLMVTNTGTLPDTFNLDTPVNNPPWTVQPIPVQVSLAAGASGQVKVMVTIPASTPAGSLHDLTVRAISETDNTIQDIAQLETSVAENAWVELAPDISKEAAPAQLVKFVHTLTNNGNFADTISLEAVTDAGWLASVQPVVANLPAGASLPVTVTVQVPPGTGAGITTSVQVTATSSIPVGIQPVDYAYDQITIQKVAGVLLAPNNQGVAPAGYTITYNHTLTNTGNAADTFNLSAISSNGWTVALSTPTLTLNAGESGTFSVTIHIPLGASNMMDVTAVLAVSSFDAGVGAVAANTTRVGSETYLPLVFTIDSNLPIRR